jgi:hypothetical protein
MAKRVLPILLLSLFVLTLTGFSLQNPLGPAVSENKFPTLNERHFPDAELERLQTTMIAGLSLLQKNSVHQGVFSIVVFNNALYKKQVSVIKTSFLLIKQYLVQIYPFHGFW